MTLGSKIKQLRESKKYSQEELAELLKVHSVTISKWENGTQEPRAKRLNELAKILGVSNEYLLNDSSNIQDTNKSQVVLEDTGRSVKPFQSMAYWGSVADNARYLALHGDSDIIEGVSKILELALVNLKNFILTRKKTPALEAGVVHKGNALNVGATA